MLKNTLFSYRMDFVIPKTRFISAVHGSKRLFHWKMFAAKCMMKTRYYSFFIPIRFIKLFLWGTVYVNSSVLHLKWHVRFIKVPFKPLSERWVILGFLSENKFSFIWASFPETIIVTYECKQGMAVWFSLTHADPNIVCWGFISLSSPIYICSLYIQLNFSCEWKTISNKFSLWILQSWCLLGLLDHNLLSVFCEHCGLQFFLDSVGWTMLFFKE